MFDVQDRNGLPKVSCDKSSNIWKREVNQIQDLTVLDRSVMYAPFSVYRTGSGGKKASFAIRWFPISKLLPIFGPDRVQF